jgi:hypothetical protein
MQAGQLILQEDSQNFRSARKYGRGRSASSSGPRDHPIFREPRGRPKSGSEGRVAASNRRDARRGRLPLAAVHCRAGDQHSPTSLCLGRSDAIDAAPRDAHPRLLCRWEGSARSAALRFIATGPDGGIGGLQGRVDAVPRGVRLGAACTTRICPREKSMRARSKCPRQTQTARHGCG